MSPSASSIDSSTAGSEAAVGALLGKMTATKLAPADIKEWLALDENGDWIKRVWDNRFVLRALGLYERALILAIECGSWHPRAYRRAMFDFATPTALRLAGDPLPPGERFTVYRGVGGGGRDRLVRGYSWTPDKDVARLFAQFFGGPQPQLYEAVIEECHVLAYLHRGYRNGLRVDGVNIAEKEMIVHPRDLPHVKRIPYEPLLPITTRTFTGECGCGCGENAGYEEDQGAYQ